VDLYIHSSIRLYGVVFNGVVIYFVSISQNIKPGPTRPLLLVVRVTNFIISISTSVNTVII
jgi:hypothetical protein